MTYGEAIQFLYDLRMFGTKFGLENTFKLAALAGNPQDKLRFIHVAGTNGKGSTCAMFESIYRTSGLRVGLFTSPHLVSFAERIQVNRQLISEQDVARLVSEMKVLLKQFPSNQPPTFFEVVAVMALKFFAEEDCDLVIWETGMGGRLDATNIVTPLASVITNVQFDHQKWLGDTVEKIAFEKAGIIKSRVPVITAAADPAVLNIISETAKKENSPITYLTTGLPAETPVSLLGEHQRLNAALAVATVGVLQETLPVSDAAIKTGLAAVSWPGRLQVVRRPGKTIVLDGAHNPGSAEVLKVALHKSFPDARPTVILGILRDKDCVKICEIVAPLARKICLVPVNSERTATPDELKENCQQANAGVRVIACNSVSQALRETVDDPFILITGSLYLIGEAMELLNLSHGGHSERNLNERIQ